MQTASISLHMWAVVKRGSHSQLADIKLHCWLVSLYGDIK